MMRSTGGRGLLGLLFAGCFLLSQIPTPAEAGRSGPSDKYKKGAYSRTGGKPFTPTAPVKRYEWSIGFKKDAPDCFLKNVLVVNGEFQPEVRVKRGEILEIYVQNDLPEDYPSISDGGVTIHWHGLSLVGSPWYDGASYINQCPILPGKSFTYRFPITDAAGTYFWHDHASGNHADGLAGPFIIEPEDSIPPQDEYDAEETIFLHDWFHSQGDVLAMSLNRPFDANQQSEARGAWNWVTNSQTTLINGQAYYDDCTLVPPPVTTQATCAVKRRRIAAGLAGQPSASISNPGCTHYSLTVEASKTYRLRIVNAGTITYQSVCFEGHKLTVIAADATPTEPVEVECVDVNVGQRFDVLLTANKPIDNYWITSVAQYRIGTPNGYGVLHYEGAPNDAVYTKISALPTTPVLQPAGVPAWGLDTIRSIVTRANLLDAKTAKGLYLFPGKSKSLAVPQPSKAFAVQITQPLLESTGQLRWGLSNVAHADSPTCNSLLEDVYKDPRFLQRNEVEDPNAPMPDNGLLGQQEAGSRIKGKAYYLDKTFPIKPVAGKHVLRIDIGDVVDVVIQNNPASSYNGAYPSFPRPGNGTEQHPFHLHGHHFWVLAVGTGNFAADAPPLNTKNPIYRDTVTIPLNGYAVIRFQADNPGTWLLHCHIFWHQFMGQHLVFSEGIKSVPRPPRDLPRCPSTCPASFAPWTPGYIDQAFANSGYEVPINAVAAANAAKAAG